MNSPPAAESLLRDAISENPAIMDKEHTADNWQSLTLDFEMKNDKGERQVSLC
ncbi:hypothetical protein ACVNPZ_15045 [Staphylococcus aureus]